METYSVTTVVINLLLVLVAGLVAGVVCKRLAFSLLVGYLVVGALLGDGGLGWVAGTQHELKYLAEAGALFLLFAVGLEFSLEELAACGGTLSSAAVCR
jgi:monovalent cation:H+ antiporter-2, CPA2 family